jgi:heat shock protein HtpX
MTQQSISYTIETEVPDAYASTLLDFIHTQYLLLQKRRFSSIEKKTVEERLELSYTVLDSEGRDAVRVNVTAMKPIRVTLTPISSGAGTALIEEAKQDIAIAVRMFEEKTRKTTLYFAWREGENIVPEEFQKQEKPLNRMLLETQILLFIVFITIGMVLFLVIGWLAPLVLIAAQFVIVLFSSKIIARSVEWTITEKNPLIHILQYHIPLALTEQFMSTYSKDKLLSVKREIYNEVIRKKGEVSCSEAGKILEKHGIICQPENLIVKKINVYELVKRVADRFGYPVPKIVVSNNMVPNAAASGPSPKHGVVLITTGLFVQLNEEEVLSVLGHEFGHLKGRDPLILFGLTAGEFLFRFYVLFPLFPVLFVSFLFFLYYWAIMTVIFFVAKFFEARADLISAIVIGQPETLARALEKIGFQKLLYERTSSYRTQEWIGFDPHPPIYFRIQRLRNIKDASEIKYPLIQSIKDVVAGFVQTVV